MTTGTGKIMLISLVVSLLTGTVVYFMVAAQAKKIGVIDAVRLFDQYNMKKELEGRSKGKFQSMGKQLDSLANALNMAKATKNADEEKNLTYAYSYFKQRLEAEYKQNNQEINQQVWKRLNTAIEEYGKNRKLHLIIGANGMGSVLYDDETYDMTNDAIQFINKKYEQGN